MNEFEILLTVMIAGLGFVGGILMLMWSEIKETNKKVEDIDRRLCRIEGSLSTHGHCLFNQSHKETKAE